MSFQPELSAAHIAAVNRRRRIIVQYDAYDDGLGRDIKDWIEYRFNYADEPGSQIDSLWWDIGMGEIATGYPSKIFPRFEHPGLQKWWQQGIDWVQVCVDESKKRNLEVFWNHRISEVIDMLPSPTEPRKVEQHPWKKAHPDWVIKSWWWPGLWNLTAPAVWDFKLQNLREIAENYAFDGIQVDFSRHVPCLPPGHQWEHRDCVTEFLRRVRRMLLDTGKKCGRPILLSAKVPENLEGCRIDGFDVETWARENIVDMFTLGSRSIDVDLEVFRKITRGRNIKLYPCFDDHHATDAYRYPPIEFFRGVFANWWQQGADGVETFNWSNAVPELEMKIAGRSPGPLSQRQAYHEIGAPETMKFKDKIFAIQRRWGYPWAEGYFNQNSLAPLPLWLAHDGRPAELTMRIADDVAEAVRRHTFKEAHLRLVLFNSLPDDNLAVKFNGRQLAVLDSDATWKEPHIFSPKEQPASGGEYPVDPQQKLLMLRFNLAPELLRLGANQISIGVAQRGAYPWQGENQIKVEKVEVHLHYSDLKQGKMNQA